MAVVLIALLSYALWTALRLWRRARIVAGLLGEGGAPRAAALVVGELDRSPVVDVAEGPRVVLEDGTSAVQGLAQHDVVVLDGPLLDGAVAAVSVAGRVGWAKVRHVDAPAGADLP